jgi:hypothetical protein
VPAPPPPPQPLRAYLRLVAIAAAIGIPAAFGSLLVGTEGLDAVPAAVLACAAAWITMAALEPRPPDPGDR